MPIFFLFTMHSAHIRMHTRTPNEINTHIAEKKRNIQCSGYFLFEIFPIWPFESLSLSLTIFFSPKFTSSIFIVRFLLVASFYAYLCFLWLFFALSLVRLWLYHHFVVVVSNSHLTLVWIYNLYSFCALF